MYIKKRTIRVLMSYLLVITTLLFGLPTKAAGLQSKIPEIKYASAPVTEYSAGDRIHFDIYTPNYNERVEYRVVLWNDSKKTYCDLWNAENGYPNRYYTKWQPSGKTIFTLGWTIFEPGYYKITVYVKRLGISNDKTALKGMNCDSYMESAVFIVKPRMEDVDCIMPLDNISVTQGSIPELPESVRVVLKDKSEKDLGVDWGTVDTSHTGEFTLQGNVEGTDKRAELKLTVSPEEVNVDTVTAADEECVNIVLKDAINFIPDIKKFKLLNAYKIPVKINSHSLSQDRKVILLQTDDMVIGGTYKLVMYDKEYPFKIPESDVNKISIREIGDIYLDKESRFTIHSIASTKFVDLAVFSSDNDVAMVGVIDESIHILPKSIGTSTITVTAEKGGYEHGARSFNVYVCKLTAYPEGVNESISFDKTIKLDITGNASIGKDFSVTKDIMLGEDFKELQVELLTPVDAEAKSISLRLTGSIAVKYGSGSINLLLNNDGYACFLGTRVNVDPKDSVSKPIALPGTGYVDLGTKVTLHSPTEGATIYYTVNSDEKPTTRSTKFEDPIIINKDTRIYAIAVKDGMKDSMISTFNFYIQDGSEAMWQRIREAGESKKKK